MDGSCRKHPAHIIHVHVVWLVHLPKWETGQSKRVSAKQELANSTEQTSVLIPTIRGRASILILLLVSSVRFLYRYLLLCLLLLLLPLLLLLLLHAHHPSHTTAVYHYRSSAPQYYYPLRTVVPRPAQWRLDDLAPRSLDCCAMQIVLSIAAISVKGSGLCR